MESTPILPLGSVIRLIDGDPSQYVMIIGRGVLTTAEDKDKEHEGYFDYAGVLIPTGLVDSSQVSFFNRENVKDVIFIGYRDALEQRYEDNYDSFVAASKFEKLHVPQE